MRFFCALVIAGCLVASTVRAETASYGAVELTGLSRAGSWPYNPPGESNAMVCNVNGPDGFLTVRAGPGAGHRAQRSLNRLAVIVVDTRYREGHWVRVVGAYRNHDKHGSPQAYKNLPVAGFAHDGYLCDFLD